MPQIFGGPSILADEKEHPIDQPKTEESTLTASMQDDQSEQSAEAQCSSGDELIEILSGVEKQIERLRGLHLTHEKKLNSIAQRSRALEDAELSFDSDSRSLKQREEELEERASELEALQLKLTDQQTEIEQERQSHKQEQAELAKQQKAAEIEFESLKEQRVVIEQREETLADEEHQQHQQHQQQELTAAMHAEIEQAQLEIKRDREEFNKEREALANLRLENEGQAASSQEREVEFQQRQIKLDQKSQSYTAQLRELEQEREGLKKERDALQALRLEKEDQSASSQEREVEFQQRQIKLDQKQQSFAALQRELEQERESLLSQKESLQLEKAELEKKRNEYESQQSELQQQVDNEAENGSELENQIRLLKDELAERDQADLTINQQQEQIEQLKSELADIRIKADPHLMQRKDERIEELVEALHQARGQIGGEQSIDESEARVQQLLSENELLRIQLERATIDTANDKQTSEALTDAISTTAPADESGPVGQEIQALQAEVQLLHQQADVQDSQNENDELETIADIQAPGDSNELELVDLDEEDTFRGTNPLSHPSVQAPFEKPVIVPPQNYIKRKTGPVKIITTLGWLTVASVIIAGASWLAANHYFPATVSASVSFKAGSQSNAALTSEQKQLWQDWHTNMLTDAEFTSMLSNRLAARRLDQYADVNTLRVYLAENLAVDLLQPDAITLTLAGTDKNELAALLDTLATTFISQSDESLRDNYDGLKTLAVGARRQGNQVLYASLNPTPILDERMKYASYMFAVGFGGAVILVTFISRRPVRPSDIFTDSDPVFVTPQR
ncbi:MAG: hypothetical protein IH984_12965 [Planctomycetes bacterium]|nr:hypothetical protein [Planctomycetota bacterium]